MEKPMSSSIPFPTYRGLIEPSTAGSQIIAKERRRAVTLKRNDTNILFYQTGDFADAYRRLEEGGPETFRDQRASVEFVASLRSHYTVTTIAQGVREYWLYIARHSIPITITDPSAIRG